MRWTVSYSLTARFSCSMISWYCSSLFNSCLVLPDVSVSTFCRSSLACSLSLSFYSITFFSSSTFCSISSRSDMAEMAYCSWTFSSSSHVESPMAERKNSTANCSTVSCSRAACLGLYAWAGIFCLVFALVLPSDFVGLASLTRFCVSYSFSGEGCCWKSFAETVGMQ